MVAAGVSPWRLHCRPAPAETWSSVRRKGGHDDREKWFRTFQRASSDAAIKCCHVKGLLCSLHAGRPFSVKETPRSVTTPPHHHHPLERKWETEGSSGFLLPCQANTLLMLNPSPAYYLRYLCTFSVSYISIVSSVHANANAASQ